MQKRVNLGLKFTIVALSIGLFSPSFHVDTAKSMEDDYSTTLPEIEIVLFNQAEAAPIHRQARRVSRRTSRRTSRRVSRRHNVVYGGSRYYGGGYYPHPHPHPGAAVAAGVVTGMAVGAAVAAPRHY